MTDYNQANNFTAKDDLPAGTAGEKLVMGAEWDEEFALIVTAVASKYDSTDLAAQGDATTGTDNTKLMTPLRVAQELAAFGQNGLSEAANDWTHARASPTVGTSYANAFSGVSLPAALNEFELEIPYTRGGTGTILSVLFTTFTSTPSQFVAVLDDPNSSGGFKVIVSVDPATAIVISSTGGSDTVVIRGFINALVAGTFAVQMKYTVSGGTGQPVIDNATLRTRRLS